MRLAGTLRGPMCAYSHTLPANFELVDRGPGESLLAAGLVPEPCLWTPEMPHVYETEIELRRGSQVIAHARRLLGIRPMGARGHDLINAGERWVLRGTKRLEPQAERLHVWHDNDLAICLEGTAAGDALCEAASRVGVFTIAQFDRWEQQSIRRVSRWPAVGIVAVRDAATVDPTERPPNLLLAQAFAPDEPIVPRPWAQIALCEVAGDVPKLALNACPLPVLVRRMADGALDPAAARRACDRLQRDLAAQGQFAGYLV